MIDCKGNCRQGRDTCSTPGSCGFYGQLNTANSDGSNPDLPMEPDTDWLIWTCKVVAYLVIAVVLFGIAGGFVWKRIGG